MKMETRYETTITLSKDDVRRAIQEHAHRRYNFPDIMKAYTDIIPGWLCDGEPDGTATATIKIVQENIPEAERQPEEAQEEEE